MANVQQAFGLKPVRYMSGKPYTGACETFIAPDDYSTDLYIGDPVVLTGEYSDTAFPHRHPEINLATAAATNPLCGAIVGFNPTPGVVANGYGAADTYREVLVATDPDLLFEIMEDSDSNAVTAVEMGLNAIMVAGSGSSVTKRSGWTLDSTSAAADATFALTIRDIANRADNAFPADYAKLLVSINLHQYRLAPVAGT